ncbi:hypothetical protein [Desulfitobacterium sp. AusDCA]|uniref:hypothetical protein n=1 Tax=Desulfitobacterium sp. AusDCA TaxID=3240383 RepID=UPI003DA6FC77
MSVLLPPGEGRVLVLFSVMVLFLATVNVPKANATTGFPITDNNSVTVQINGARVFSITVSDANVKFINIDSSTPVKTQLIPVNTGYQPFIRFDSADYRVGSRIAWHFIPGSIKNLGVGFSDSDGQAPDNSQAVILNNGSIGSEYVFRNVKLFTTGTNQAEYGIYVSNPNSPNAGAAYTVTIQKVSSF